SNAVRTVWDAEAIDTSHLGFRPIQKIATIHASSGFIWGIPIQMFHRHQLKVPSFHNVMRKERGPEKAAHFGRVANLYHWKSMNYKEGLLLDATRLQDEGGSPHPGGPPARPPGSCPAERR